MLEGGVFSCRRDYADTDYCCFPLRFQCTNNFPLTLAKFYDRYNSISGQIGAFGDNLHTFLFIIGMIKNRLAKEPNGKGLPRWEPFTKEAPQVMEIGEGLGMMPADGN